MPNQCSICLEGELKSCCRVLLYAGCQKDVFSCSNCGAAYVFPSPTVSEIAGCYEPSYHHEFLKQYWKDYYKGRVVAEKLSAWKPEGDFLDVGCALGVMLAGIRDFSRWRPKGLEFSPTAIKLGRELNNIEIERAALSQAPWPAQSFDYIHINNVLEHELEPVQALESAARLLRPKGRLELIVPNGPVDLRPNIDLERKWGRPVPTRHGGHIFFFSRKSLEILFKRCGFRLLSIECFHFKTGMKARGWLPRAYRAFRKVPPVASAGAPSKEMTVEEARRLIPAQKPSWPVYYGKYCWRNLWRYGGKEFGYDFAVMAEKL